MSLMIGSDGFPLVSMYDSTAADLLVLHCRDADCWDEATRREFFAVARVDTAGSVGAEAALTIGSDGMPLISYYDATNTALKVAHCNRVDCSQPAENTFVTVDPEYRGRPTAITIGSHGLPVIAYDAHGLRVTHCGAPDCSTGNTITDVRDATSLNGSFFPAIAIGANGFPLIAYCDDGPGTGARGLKLAACGDITCTSGNVVELIETITDCHASPLALTIGSDGLPVIAYVNGYTHMLRVAKLVSRPLGRR